MQKLKILILLLAAISILVLPGCKERGSYGEIYVPIDKQKSSDETPAQGNTSNNTQPSSSENIPKDQNYEIYGLVKNPYNDVDPIGWTDGSKYGLDKITMAEEYSARSVMKNHDLDVAIRVLKGMRLTSGGVPFGLLNEIIPAGRRLDSDDLRLGWIDIDEDISSVIGKLGEPYKIEDKNGEKIYFFGSPESSDYKGAVMELTVKDSHVSSIVSCGAGITTPRGISACGKLSSTIDASSSYHDTRADVMSYYGVIGYTTTDYEDMELIEYTVNSKKGQPCILRFAVNKADQYIYYISIRHK